MLLNPIPAALRSVRYTSLYFFPPDGRKKYFRFPSRSSKGKETYWVRDLAGKRYSANDIYCVG